MLHVDHGSLGLFCVLPSPGTQADKEPSNWDIVGHGGSRGTCGSQVFEDFLPEGASFLFIFH